jgi:O-antigen/teichoic acid export membrane protein
MSLAGRAIRSATWAGSAASLVMVIGFVRSVLLARLLPIEVFGVYALAFAIVSLSGALAGFGLSEALLHRSPETAEEEPAAATHFTLTAAASL